MAVVLIFALPAVSLTETTGVDDSGVIGNLAYTTASPDSQAMAGTMDPGEHGATTLAPGYRDTPQAVGSPDGLWKIA